jgi:hypothetical protein
MVQPTGREPRPGSEKLSLFWFPLVHVLSRNGLESDRARSDPAMLAALGTQT